MEATESIQVPEANEAGDPQFIIFAKDQPPYKPLPALVYQDGVVVTEWTLDIEEIQRIKAGAPIRLSIHLNRMICDVCGPQERRHLLQPVKLEVGDVPQ